MEKIVLENNSDRRIHLFTEFDNLRNADSEILEVRSTDDLTIPIQFIPNIHRDKRGCFCETFSSSKQNEKKNCYDSLIGLIFNNTKQINRSESLTSVCRGFHAQSGASCQGKLVECLSLNPIWDIIVDMRPDSKSFCNHTLVKLSATEMVKLWVPKGFIHCVIASKYMTMPKEQEDGTTKKMLTSLPIYYSSLQYFTDNDYNPEAEITIKPDTLLNAVLNPYVQDLKEDREKNFELLGLVNAIADGLTFSDKDLAGEDAKDFIDRIQKEYKETGKLWYKS